MDGRKFNKEKSLEGTKHELFTYRIQLRYLGLDCDDQSQQNRIPAVIWKGQDRPLNLDCELHDGVWKGKRQMRFKVGRAEADWPEKSVGLQIFLFEFMNKLHLANPMS